MSATTPVKRPIGVTILAGLAGIAALLAAYHLLQSLGIIKITVGPISVRGFQPVERLHVGNHALDLGLGRPDALVDESAGLAIPRRHLDLQPDCGFHLPDRPEHNLVGCQRELHRQRRDFDLPDAAKYTPGVRSEVAISL